MKLPFGGGNSPTSGVTAVPTNEQDVPQVKASDLPIALYLNQRVTFDLLAILEDGFAQMTTLQASSSSSEGSAVEAGGQLGIGNPFAFLGLSLGGKGKRDATTKSDEVISEQLFHTPTSLFARLREQLMEKGLVKVLEANLVAFEDVVPGQFVEFEAVLRRSPAVSVLETVMDSLQSWKRWMYLLLHPAPAAQARREVEAIRGARRSRRFNQWRV